MVAYLYVRSVELIYGYETCLCKGAQEDLCSLPCWRVGGYYLARRGPATALLLGSDHVQSSEPLLVCGQECAE